MTRFVSKCWFQYSNAGKWPKYYLIRNIHTDDIKFIQLMSVKYVNRKSK